MNYGLRFVILYRRQGWRPSPRKRNAKKQNGCLGRPYNRERIQIQFSSVLSLSHVWLSVTPTAHQASLSITSSRSLLKFMSFKSVMPSNLSASVVSLLLLPSIFPSIRGFFNESVLCIRWQSVWVSASTALLPMTIQGWFPLRLSGLTSLQSKELSSVFSNTTVQKHQSFQKGYRLKSAKGRNTEDKI